MKGGSADMVLTCFTLQHMRTSGSGETMAISSQGNQSCVFNATRCVLVLDIDTKEHEFVHASRNWLQFGLETY